MSKYFEDVEAKLEDRDNEVDQRLDQLSSEINDKSIYTLKDISEVIIHDELTVDYKGQEFWKNIKKQYSVSAGEYICIVDCNYADDRASFYIGYSNEDSNASNRIIHKKGSGRSTFKVNFDDKLEDGVLEFRILYSSNEYFNAGNYSAKYYLIKTDKIPNDLIDLDYITGKLDGKLNKQYGRNLFNKDDENNIIGYYLNQLGTYSTNEKYNISGWIPVEPDSTIISIGIEGGAYSWFYDKYKESISGVANMDMQKGITVPHDARYLRISFRISSSELTMICKDELPKNYCPYTDFEPVQILDESVKFLREEVENLKGQSVSIKNNGFLTSVDRLTDGQKLELIRNLDVKNNKTICFYGKVDSFNKIYVGHGETSYGGKYIIVDNSNLYIYSYTTDASIAKTISHGLSIQNFVYITISITNNEDGVIRIITDNNQEFTSQTVNFGSCNGEIFAKSVGSNLTNCRLSWTARNLDNGIWIFGDSYLGLTNSARYPYHLLRWGYNNWLACGYPGANTSPQLISFKNLLRVGRPKYAVWTLGMNNPDTANGINAIYKSNTDEFLELCMINNIIPILATIPSTWGSIAEDSDIAITRINTFKNIYVRESGHRFVDFESAVVNSNGAGWIDGTLSTDGVHPTEKGAKLLASRFVLDFPEITN